MLRVPSSVLMLQQQIDFASRNEASKETSPFPLHTGACAASSSCRFPWQEWRQLLCFLYLWHCPALADRPWMDSQKLRPEQSKCTECGRALRALVQERKAKELSSSSSQKATAELSKAVAAAPGLHCPPSQYARWKNAAFLPNCSSSAFPLHPLYQAGDKRGGWRGGDRQPRGTEQEEFATLKAPEAAQPSWGSYRRPAGGIMRREKLLLPLTPSALGR